MKSTFPIPALPVLALLFSAPFLAGIAVAEKGAPAAVSTEPVLEREIARIAGAVTGSVGAAAIHLENGRTVSWNGGNRFPMASVYKIPIAVALLSRTERGEVDLDSMVTLRRVDHRPGSGILADYFETPGVVLSLRNMLRLSLLISDNTATDIVLGAAGGPATVTKRIRELGFDGIRVDRSTLQLLLAVDGAEGMVADDAYTREAFDRAVGAVPDGQRAAAAYRAFIDVRDTSTPLAMAGLLQSIWKGEAVGREGRALLLGVMKESVNARRLRGMLPPGLEPPPHKTGTIWGGGLHTVNDAGIVALPGGAGHVALALFITRSSDEMDDLEEILAQISRTMVDYFLLVPSGP